MAATRGGSGPPLARRLRRRLTPEAWLSELSRGFAALAATIVVGVPTAAVVTITTGERLASFDATLISFTIYLAAWSALTTWSQIASRSADVEDWARREGRGTFTQRYVYGTMPGPGLSIMVGALALGTGVVWLPRGAELGSTLGGGERLVLGIVVVVVSWFAMAVSFAVSYRADDLATDARVLTFPGDEPVGWSDYLFMSTSVSTSFGTNDVVVLARATRRTMTVHAVVAFVYNTVILSAVVSAVAAL